MTFTLYAPAHCRSEIGWIADVLLRQRLGLNIHIADSAIQGYQLENNGKYIELPDIFFACAKDAWLQIESIPTGPLRTLDVGLFDSNLVCIDEHVPVLCGNGRVVDGGRALGVDVLGSAFFLLSRYEEAIVKDRDAHDRFPAVASVAYKAGFLDRPIVDEYVELLWACMTKLWPGLERKRSEPRTLVSCDVDNPYVLGNGTVNGTLHRMAGDVIKRHSPRLAWQSMAQSWRWRRGDWTSDPFLSAIDWMMDVNERAGNCVAFYFIADQSHPTLDGGYSMDAPVIRDLVRRIAARGHEIGLHASYNTYRDAVQTRREADILQRVLAAAGIKQAEIGGRQHFLRWQTPITARNWEAAGMDYDSTLSFADRPGFRCGTCHEFPMYDVVERRPIKLRQRPLIVMECSVIDDRYMGLGYSETALDMMIRYKKLCHKFGGDFTLLWHNSHLDHPEDRRYYEMLVQ